MKKVDDVVLALGPKISVVMPITTESVAWVHVVLFFSKITDTGDFREARKLARYQLIWKIQRIANHLS
jgi:hypothetical protein